MLVSNANLEIVLRMTLLRIKDGLFPVLHVEVACDGVHNERREEHTKLKQRILVKDPEFTLERVIRLTWDCCCSDIQQVPKSETPKGETTHSLHPAYWGFPPPRLCCCSTMQKYSHKCMTKMRGVKSRVSNMGYKRGWKGDACLMMANDKVKPSDHEFIYFCCQTLQTPFVFQNGAQTAGFVCCEGGMGLEERRVHAYLPSPLLHPQEWWVCCMSLFFLLQSELYDKL